MKGSASAIVAESGAGSGAGAVKEYDYCPVMSAPVPTFFELERTVGNDRCTANDESTSFAIRHYSAFEEDQCNRPEAWVA